MIAAKDVPLGMLKACGRNDLKQDKDKFDALLEAVFRDPKKAGEKEKAACAKLYNSLRDANWRFFRTGSDSSC